MGNKNKKQAPTTPLYKMVDISRGPFEPQGVDMPPVLHPDKTRQDRMPKDQRPRHQDSERRRSKM